MTVQRRRSSRSNNGTCVDVAMMPDHVLVRDSKDLAGPVPAGEWRRFLAVVGR